jgi:hypothetical protein
MALKGLAGWPVEPVEPVKKGIMSNFILPKNGLTGSTGQPI